MQTPPRAQRRRPPERRRDEADDGRRRGVREDRHGRRLGRAAPRGDRGNRASVFA